MATNQPTLADLTRNKTAETAVEKSVEIIDGQAFAFLLCNTTGGNFRLFPYHHLADAELSERKDLLVVHMWSHTVTIKGHRLLPLLQALRRAQDVTVRAQNAKYEASQGKDAAFVTDIEIVKRKEDDDEQGDGGSPGGREISLEGDSVSSAAVRGQT
jgi:hypothetical protein